MTPKHLVVLAIILSYTGVFLIFRKKALSYFGGLEYLFIGVIISFFNVKTSGLIPLIYPFLGWIGLLIGLQLKFNYLKGLNRHFYKATFFYTFTASIIAGGILYLFGYGKSATAVGIALTGISYKIAAHFLKSKDKKTRETLFFISFVPFVALSLMLLFYLFTYNASKIFYFISFSVLFSFISWFIFKLITDKDSILLILIGFIIFISETCAVASISPLVMGFIIGVFLTNFSKWKEFIFISLFKDEKPLYILFLLILGLSFGFSFNISVIALTVVAIIVSVFVKITGSKLKELPISNHNFIYTLSPGGFGIAIATDYWLVSGAITKTPWFTAVIITIVILQFTVTIAGDKK